MLNTLVSQEIFASIGLRTNVFFLIPLIFNPEGLSIKQPKIEPNKSFFLYSSYFEGFAYLAKISCATHMYYLYIIFYYFCM